MYKIPYSAVEIEFVIFAAQDIISASDETSDTTGGSTSETTTAVADTTDDLPWDYVD